ncbi:hypothetical protein GGS23DRAFT_594690 [Durotheca rogersii]|uniref:uncharacterized protein n=1 Tax=Durotheca rogersii TaxID=419775 RepID=UPI002220929D|nr:uncharacterized protein GGS23DRAFT_594690 [Durotheca rogersii]KAI5865141.1 hypothetical protein GGS23DRAFT_594690 [Durotheca rogersii]
MARPRIPRRSGITLAALRILAMGASVALLANLIYGSVNWGQTFGLSFTMVAIALLVDGTELAGLLDSSRAIPRVHPACVNVGDIVVFFTAFPSVFLVLLGDSFESSRPGPYPWELTNFLSLILTTVIW